MLYTSEWKLFDGGGGGLGGGEFGLKGRSADLDDPVCENRPASESASVLILLASVLSEDTPSAEEDFTPRLATMFIAGVENEVVTLLLPLMPGEGALLLLFMVNGRSFQLLALTPEA